MCGRGLIPEATALMGKYWVLPEQRFSSNLSIMCFGQPLSPEVNVQRWIGDNVINFDTIKGVITQSRSHSLMISLGLYERILLNQDLWAISSLTPSFYGLQRNPINATIFIFPHFIPDLLQQTKIFSVSLIFQTFFSWTLPAIGYFPHSSSPLAPPFHIRTPERKQDESLGCRAASSRLHSLSSYT